MQDTKAKSLYSLPKITLMFLTAMARYVNLYHQQNFHQQFTRSNWTGSKIWSPICDLFHAWLLELFNCSKKRGGISFSQYQLMRVQAVSCTQTFLFCSFEDWLYFFALVNCSCWSPYHLSMTPCTSSWNKCLCLCCICKRQLPFNKKSCYAKIVLFLLIESIIMGG